MSEPTGRPISLPAPPRRRRLTGLLMGLVFVAGGVVGSAVTFHLLLERIQEGSMHPEAAPGRITQRMRDKLDLTDQQAREVRDILERRQQELMTIRREIHPRVQAIMDASREEIAAVLTVPQQAKWRRMYEHFERRWMGPHDRGRRDHGDLPRRGPGEEAFCPPEGPGGAETPPAESGPSPP